MKRMSKTWESAGTVVWILLILAIVAGGALLYKTFKVPQKSQVVVADQVPEPVVSTPTPEIEPTPTPVPVVTPEPTPEPSPSPEPTPALPPPLSLLSIAQDRKLWPPEISLVRPATFPAIMDGRVIGSVSKPVGSIFKVVRVTALGVEVFFNNAATQLPATSTDLLARAEKIRKPADLVAPVAPKPSIPNSPGAPSFTNGNPVVPNAKVLDGKNLDAKKLIIEIIRNKRSKIEGGDYDDKVDHIELRVKVDNPDPLLATEKLQARVFVFAESILERGKRVLLGRSMFECSLKARGSISHTTPEYDCAYDTTGARFGYKYSGWIVEFKNPAGTSVFTKASAPSLEKAFSLLDKLKDKGLYKSNFEFDGTTVQGRTNSLGL